MLYHSSIKAYGSYNIPKTSLGIFVLLFVLTMFLNIGIFIEASILSKWYALIACTALQPLMKVRETKSSLYPIFVYTECMSFPYWTYLCGAYLIYVGPFAHHLIIHDQISIECFSTILHSLYMGSTVKLTYIKQNKLIHLWS